MRVGQLTKLARVEHLRRVALLMQGRARSGQTVRVRQLMQFARVEHLMHRLQVAQLTWGYVVMEIVRVTTAGLCGLCRSRWGVPVRRLGQFPQIAEIRRVKHVR
ncbi:hypothetical protein GCM10009555_091690 [Acrocarpospora macrocephala]|uniref:Uncharacterized protein n=1 Tax=Acrocarpospora macrocephala TaxID=150177 RepID=A0A5M3WIY4_9ACTN|nr:hypothetical protein Amac_027410 [Acrocarpospora macrocephala]